MALRVVVVVLLANLVAIHSDSAQRDHDIITAGRATGLASRGNSAIMQALGHQSNRQLRDIAASLQTHLCEKTNLLSDTRRSTTKGNFMDKTKSPKLCVRAGLTGHA